MVKVILNLNVVELFLFPDKFSWLFSSKSTGLDWTRLDLFVADTVRRGLKRQIEHGVERFVGDLFLDFDKRWKLQAVVPHGPCGQNDEPTARRVTRLLELVDSEVSTVPQEATSTLVNSPVAGVDGLGQNLNFLKDGQVEE